MNGVHGVHGVRGCGPVAALCWRCLVVLTVANVPVAVLGWSLGLSDGFAFALGFFPWIITVVAILIAVVGFPAGLLVSHLLRGQADECRHVAAFATTGAVLSVTICVVADLVHGPTAWLVVLVAAAEGAIGAGGARWWSGRNRRARRPPSDEQVEDDAVNRALGA